MKKINKLLIANRGEIAIRVIKTCKKMGIKTVAVFSEPDALMPFVSAADESYFLGGSTAAESYLDIEKIIKAIKETGADAVHPGYGFLSEKANFVKRLEDEGIIFVGPNSFAVDSMGDKINSKKLALEAKVCTVPGCKDVIENVEHAKKVALDIGFPVIMKASAGGGGKGIRIVREGDDVGILFTSVQNEGKKAFGDDRIFIEKFIENPRHIEIQVVADKHGNVVCLGERECSIQRSNQKVIEEAPSLFVEKNIGMREKMYLQSVSLAKKVGYDSVGTVEYVVAQNGDFYFLEMNTRLQVEHPVTEYVTGFDLVEIMIRIAQGEKLWFSQNDVKLVGHAFETRICAEDPVAGFMPSVGRISTYIEPKQDISAGVRIDSGVVSGMSITPFYDSMIAKAITYAPTRDEARIKAIQVLNRFVIEGLATNITFAQEIYKHPRFASSDISTLFIKQEFPNGFSYDLCRIDDEVLKIFACASLVLHFKNREKLQSMPGSYTNTNALKEKKPVKDFVMFFRDKSVSVDLNSIDGSRVFAHVAGFECEFSCSYSLGSKVMKLSFDNNDFYVKVVKNSFSSFTLSYNGILQEVSFRNSMIASYFEICKNNLSSVKKVTDLESPLTGLIVGVFVKEGEEVKIGMPLVSIEAMKMENVILSEANCTVKKVKCQAGDSVSIGDILIDF